MSADLGDVKLMQKRQFNRKLFSNDDSPCPVYASQKFRGFTLIELLITIVIVAILAAIAYPSYVDSVRKSRRTDAKTALLDLARREESFFSTNNAYSVTPSDLGYTGAWPASIPSASPYNYALSVTAADTTSFSMQAVPQGDQVNDTCGTYTLDQTGNQGNTSNSTPSSQCW